MTIYKPTVTLSSFNYSSELFTLCYTYFAESMIDLKGLCHAISRYISKKLKPFSHQLTPKVIRTMAQFCYRRLFLWSLATDDKDGHE